MTPEEIDRILSSDESLEPSSAFAMNVMAAIRLQRAEPPPLAFPWLRFAAGMAASAVMAGAGTVLLDHVGSVVPAASAAIASLAPVAPQLGYAAAALLVSFGLASLLRVVEH